MKIGRCVIFLWIAWFLSANAFTTRPNPIAQLGMIIFGLCLLGFIISSAISGIANIRSRGAKDLLPTLFSIIIIIAAPMLGFGLRSLIFRWNMPRYQTAAQWVEQQKFDSTSFYVNLNPPAEFSDLAYAIHASRTKDCGTVIWFFWGSGFPVKHTVRIYSPEESVTRAICLGDWHPARKLTEDWYEASA